MFNQELEAVIQRSSIQVGVHKKVHKRFETLL